MSSDDEDIWASYAKTVKPLGAVKKKRASAKTALPVRTVKNTQSVSKKTSKTIKKEPLPAILFDRRAERRLRQGDIDIDARIDLHGMRQGEAHDALLKFINRQIKAGSRTLLIITGKGRDGFGVLRSSITGWLAASSYASQILAIRQAPIQHGGSGAFYVLLKRARVTK